jgi:transcription initiation factor TFIIH subunit 2
MEAAKTAAVQFTNEYFDLNPISQLSVVSTADRVARKLSDLSSSAKNHVNRVAAVTAGQGMPSLQNALRLAVVALKHVPAYARREVLVLFSSLSTCDPGDIFSTAAEAAALKIRISFVCLAAEVYVCRRVAELTDGTFGVARDNAHLQELVRAHAVPVPDAKTEGDPSAEFLYVGFPRRVKEEYRALAYDGAEAVLASAAYVCPRCQTRVTMLPAQCSVCALQLNSSAHIARSHHHVFPVPPFLAVAVQDEPTGLSCLGCLQWLGTAGGTFRCPNCTNAFCGDCDLFVHESLHNCPGCTS